MFYTVCKNRENKRRVAYFPVGKLGYSSIRHIKLIIVVNVSRRVHRDTVRRDLQFVSIMYFDFLKFNQIKLINVAHNVLKNEITPVRHSTDLTFEIIYVHNVVYI